MATPRPRPVQRTDLAMRDQQVILVHPEAPPKPALGQPCNGCGLCCLAEPCPLGVVLSRQRSGACVALRWDDAQHLYRCGVLTHPAGVLPVRWPWLTRLLQRLARRWIAAGKGCDAALEVHTPPR